MDCRTTPAVNFNTRPGFSQHDPTMTQEQSILSKIVTLFLAEEIILQHNVLGYRTGAYFTKYRLAIEIEKQEHNDRSIDYEIERQKAIEKELDCKIIRINPAKKNLISSLKLAKSPLNQLKQLTEESIKKSLIDELSNQLVRLEFKSNNSIKTKCLKYVVKKIVENIKIMLVQGTQPWQIK